MSLVGAICKIQNKEEEVLCIDKIRMPYTGSGSITGYLFLHKDGNITRMEQGHSVQVTKYVAIERYPTINEFLNVDDEH